MNVSFKLLNGQKFDLNIPADITVGQAKETIAHQKDFPREGMKLLFAGKILSEEDKKLSEYSVVNGSTMVLMVQKSKWASKPKVEEKPKEQETPAPVASAASDSSSSSTTETITTTEKPPIESENQKKEPESQKPTAESEKAQQTSQPQQPAQSQQQQQTATQESTVTSADSVLVAGDSYNQAVENLMAMGFERERVEVCMRAAFNNPDRAAEFLLTGLPPGFGEQQASPGSGRHEHGAEEIDSDLYGDTESGGGVMEDILEGEGGGAEGEIADLGALLERIPQFNQLRAAVQANPNLLQPVMQQLASQSPELLHLISENPQEFVRLLNEPPRQQQQQQQAQGMGNIPPELAALFAGGAGGVGAGAHRPGTITVSAEEAEQISQLMQLGFDRGTAAQAYFACDKDMNAAADFLLTSMGDDNEWEQGGDGAEGDQQ